MHRRFSSFFPSLIIAIVIITLSTRPITAQEFQDQGEPHAGPRSMTFTSDDAEKMLYEQSHAHKGTPTSTPGPSTTAPLATSPTVTPSPTPDGIHHLVITADQDIKRVTAAPATPSETSPPTGSTPLPDTVQNDAPSPPIPNGPTPITPLKKIKAWDKLNDLYVIGGTPDQIDAALKPFIGSSGRVPPQGLIQIAALYEQMGNMKMAARYYYAAQLRARFDAARFPIGGQLAQTRVARLAGDLTPRLAPWMTQSSSRLTDVLNDLRIWDAMTPYDYHPGFGIMATKTVEKTEDMTRNDDPPPTALDDQTPQTPDESDWPNLLDETRAQFFRQTGQIADALKKMGH